MTGERPERAHSLQASAAVLRRREVRNRRGSGGNRGVGGGCGSVSSKVWPNSDLSQGNTDLVQPLKGISEHTSHVIVLRGPLPASSHGASAGGKLGEDFCLFGGRSLFWRTWSVFSRNEELLKLNTDQSR